MSDTTPNLFLIGGAHVDRLARLKAPHQAQTSNPVIMSEAVGGGSFNAGRAAKRFDINAAILSARGGDAAGLLVEEAILAAEITDHSSVHLDRTTPSYTAILEPNGELVTAIADMGLYETAIARSFKRAPVQKTASLAHALLCDANLPAAGLMNIFTEVAHGKPVFAMAISTGKVERFSQLLPHIACLFMNQYEAAALTGLPATSPIKDFADALRAKKLYRAVISAGGAPAAFLDGDSIFQITPPAIPVVDVTGAGDCLAGTMVAALLNGVDFIDAAKLGLAAASITASRHGAVPVILKEEIQALAASHQWEIK